MLTKYTLAKAVADGKLSYIKVGNTCLLYTYPRQLDNELYSIPYSD